ncbi:MAG: hypothetical protein FJ296_00295 [Planctomycetes bacterium]|nr:hypothetical protein [Planctomycetota bacterium]
MRSPKFAVAILAAAALAVPVVAAIKAMTVSELMAITTDTAHVRILEKSSFRSDWQVAGAAWTKLKVQGTSLRTGEPVDTELVFLGSHDPADHFGTSEMPTLQDTRVGAEAVVFFAKNTKMPGQPNQVFDLGGVYRVEKGFGEPVVVGKGEGFAFPENAKLADVSALVRKTHLELLAAQAGAGK